MNHGVYVSEQATSVSTPVVAASGVPFVVGVAPVQSAASAAKPNVPVLCTSWAEAVEKLGYSDDWKSYGLCEFMYSHFKLFGCQPVIFCNVLDISSMKEAVISSDIAVSNHKVKLPISAINDATLVVKSEGGAGDPLKAGTDYTAYYDGEFLIVEAMPDGACYAADKLNVAYNKVTPASVTATEIAAAFESVELCLTTIGTVPDLLCAPGYSHDPVVAAIMATKAAGINGLFTAKALIDIDCGAAGAKAYSDVLTKKTAANVVDENEIPCWPMLGLGEYKFHYSTQLAGLIAQVDSGNGGCPYESPSNKNLQCDRLILEDGTEVSLTHAQANVLNGIGVMTALNFMNGWVAWGNYTACYPANTDVKDYMIPVSRMFDWVGNTLIKTFWTKLDKPMTRRLIDSILDSARIWLNGLVGREYLLGARIEMLESENPMTDLMAGIIRLHVYMTPPSPAQEIDFILEYDANYVTSALQS